VSIVLCNAGTSFELEKLLEPLREAYEARMTKKSQADQKKMEEVQRLATGSSPLGILRALREIDDDEK
jgi:two-component system NtrC family response regulator